MGRRKKEKIHFKDKNHMDNCILTVLKNLRKNAGFTQEELAHLLGRHSAIVGKIEGKFFVPSLDIIRLYGIVFGLTTSEILAEAEKLSYVQ